MKNLKSGILLIVSILLIGEAKTQTIKWSSLKRENKHIVNVNFGADHGVVYGLAYGYQLNTKLFPMIANVEYSFPSGDNIFDDFKMKIGGQIRWFEYHHFQFSTKINGVFRRYNNDYARLLNFGSDMSGIVGYYRSKWFLAGEFGFDKAIVTHFKHSRAYLDQYPGVHDGWYEPATGGNFYYGIQAGFTIRKNDIYASAGRVVSQDFKTTPLLPYYGQLGYNLRF